ncbi:MAG: hypothetical protein KKG09_02675 [Verrucomicrobia bacterium]|nr:hypothetical protein [Verrucomicrobiota bacterium]MCG2681810.1 hypothetical protein [Kiritimatiellia bacterium]MBU4247291.1 hypothetical protein [Verrucomicrobiota bacterium]MBU4289907.1 hypothetical protein [Verrucomicrobiota bacterium]MBU4427949.1 hypothetical protein [Verrucomicrobiota bacterium]
MSELTAGYGEKVITPPQGVDLTGYGCYSNRKVDGVLDDLKAHALFLGKGTEKLVLISCNILGFTIEFVDAVRKQIAVEHDLPMQNVLLACTHTHTGPASQPLLALGEIDQAYLSGVPALIAEAVRLAAKDLRKASLRCRIETLEPIGFNRRKGNFEEIDPSLKVAVFERDTQKIYLLSYSCHPVMLGPITKVSADWPGAVTAAIERTTGHRAIVFQGFCGDVDPVTNMNRWGQATVEDLALIGQLICNRALKAEKYAEPVEVKSLKALEHRVRVPLQVPSLAEVEQQVQAAAGGNETTKRFMQEWSHSVKAQYPQLSKNPHIENVPIQALSIGKLKIIGLPGEVFSMYYLRLREKTPLLFNFGHAGGTLAYFPTTEAYQCANDYACYGSTRFYCLLPLSSELEKIVMNACETMLAELT